MLSGSMKPVGVEIWTSRSIPPPQPNTRVALDHSAPISHLALRSHSDRSRTRTRSLGSRILVLRAAAEDLPVRAARGVAWGSVRSWLVICLVASQRYFSEEPWWEEPTRAGSPTFELTHSLTHSLTQASLLACLLHSLITHTESDFFACNLGAEIQVLKRENHGVPSEATARATSLARICNITERNGVRAIAFPAGQAGDASLRHFLDSRGSLGFARTA